MVEPPEVHFPNPWSEAIPVPLEELVACCVGGTVSTPEGVRQQDQAYVLQHWHRYGEKLDGYLLIAGSQDPKTICVGVRYGAEGSQYLSPYCENRKIAIELIRKYGPQPEAGALSP
ncbi:hypothetical protein ACVIGB_000656 [Bradyrhizobium sp. USDA 4341]